MTETARPEAIGELSSRMGISSSLLLGVFAVGWGAVVSIASIRWYVGLLGIESYGLIGFFATLQAAIAIFELGLGATINREVARSAALDELGHARRLLYSLEFVYWAFALIIVLVLCFAAVPIAEYWLGSNGIDREEVYLSLRLMGLVAALRWPVGLYQGALVGLHRAQTSYKITAAMATVSNVGAVLVLTYLERSLAAYFIWQAASALAYVAWARRSAWQSLGGRLATRFDRKLLKKIMYQSIMMSGVAVSGLLLTQLDKFVVSASTTLADFGRYTLAGVMATGLSVLFIPTFNVIYPRLSALVVSGDGSERVNFYRLGTRLFVSCLFPIAFSAILYANDLLIVWTGNAELALATAPIASLLLLGSTLNGVMHFPYALQLATGKTVLPLLINGALIVIMLPLVFVFVRTYGALGGAMAWATLNTIYFAIGVWVTHHYILPGLMRRWLLHDVAPAFASAAALIVIGHYLAGIVADNHFVRLSIATMVSLGTTLLLLLGYRNTRALVKGALGAVVLRVQGADKDKMTL